MKFEQYRKLAMRTNPEKTERDNLLNACLGLSGEYAEYRTEYNRTGISKKHNQERIKDELSDIYWYVALLFETLKIEVTSIDDISEYLKLIEEMKERDTLYYIGKISDSLKKYFFQGHFLDKELISDLANKLRVSLDLLIINIDLEPSKVRAYNIEKLKKRFPEGFNVDKSVNRKE